MSSTFTQYQAIIPALFLGVPEVQPLIAFLNEWGLIRKEGADLHFYGVEECDGSGKYYLDPPDISNYDYTPPHEAPMLQQLIDTGKICLMYIGEWNNGGEDPDEKEVDVVAFAETIPTLILREVLAKRLEG